MATEKRRKQLAREKAQRQAERRAESAKRARRNRIVGWSALALVVIAFVAWAAWPDAESMTADEALASESPSTVPTESASAATTPGPVPTPKNVSCDPVDAPRSETRTWKKPQDQKLSGTVTWVLNTNCGKITAALDADKAPKTVNGLAFLSSEGYYNGNICHRLTTAGIFVVQCGSAAGDGTDNAGFTVPDENLPSQGQNNYPAGTIAMANSGPGTASSQFFLVYQDSTLGPDYTIAGKVTKGLDVVKYVAAAGIKGGSSDTTDGPPAQPLQIRTAKIE